MLITNEIFLAQKASDTEKHWEPPSLENLLMLPDLDKIFLKETIDR